MRILIDAMGGDNAPAEIVKGAVDAIRDFDISITLLGLEEQILACLKDCGAAPSERLQVVHTSEVITMEDDPSTATRKKKDASMSVMLRMLRDGEGDACISAGSTGALLSGATLTVRRIRGIRRACFAPVIPNGGKGVLLIDSGANVECTAEYLLQFAYMGSIYAKEIMGCENPRVGLLNIGAEETKGGELQKQTYELLKKAADEGRLNFVGNVESSRFMSGDVDVLVCDGYTGNILLKCVEGTAKYLMKKIKGIFYKNALNKMAALVLKKDVTQLKNDFDPSEVGGTPLLGISKLVIKAHGSSDARAIYNAVRQALAVTQANVIPSIEANIEYMRLAPAAKEE